MSVTLGLVAGTIAMLALRMNLAAVLLVLAGAVHLIWGDGALVYIVEDMWIAINKEVLLSIPLFLLCGAVMGRGQIALRLIEVMKAIAAPLPGGLAVATVLTCAVFAAVSGSSAVTLVTVGTIAYPALLREGYSRVFAIGALTAAGTLGVIIPPSVPMILYGIVTETSIVNLFIAGVLPGLLLTLLITFWTLFANRRMPRGRFDLAALGGALKKGVLSLMMPVILLGGIYSGYFSPTEAAAVALAYALFVEVVIYRTIGWRDLREVGMDTVTMMGALFPLLAIALSLNLLLTTERAPQMLAAFMTETVESRVAFILMMNLLLLLVGCVMDMFSAIMVLGPILQTVAAGYGIDPVHLGIIMTVNLEIGLLTPPVGIHLFIAMTAFREDFWTIVRGVLPFIAVMLVGLLVISFVPFLSLGLLG